MPQPDQPPPAAQPAGRSTEVVVKARRRFFSAAEKLRIVEAADRLGRGELGAMLRREGLYSSLLTDWRRLRATGQLAAEATLKRGPKLNPQVAELKRQQQEIARLQKRLRQAEAILDAQKKMSELFALSQPIEPDEQP